MIDDDGKRKAKPQPPEIPPHISEDFTPAQKKAFAKAARAAEHDEPETKRSARKGRTRTKRAPKAEAASEPKEQ